jgi:cell division transport system permease protein
MASPHNKLRKKKLGSYPFLSVVFSITLALFVIGVFGALVIYSRELERAVRQNIRIQVYLKNQITPTQQKQIENALRARYFVPQQSPTEAITFISKDEAARQFLKETGEDFKKFLGENPLRDAFLVRVDDRYQDATSLAKIKVEVEKMNGVFQVHYVENVVESINKNVTKIALILIGLAGLLLAVVVLLINNTLRLALFSQRFLIRSMQLVGARHGFIQRPFLLRALWHGALSGLLAGALLAGALYLAHQRIEELALIQNNRQLVMLVGSLVVMGIFVAIVSTWRAVHKYLKLSLDELY